MTLTRDQILATHDLPSVVVNVPEWGGEMTLKTLTGEERDRWQNDWIEWRKEQGAVCFEAFLIVAVACDPDNKPIFQRSDVRTLNAKSSAVISRLYRIAARMNGIGQEGDQRAEKN